MKSEWRIHSELDLDDILSLTYGLPIFQEQIMAILARVANWSYSEAGLLFDAFRKKNHDKMESSRPGFFDACQANGYSTEAVSALWDALKPWSDYGFNKAHTAGYGLVAYWTAYLKANHPNEYMAALLSSVSDDPDRLREYLAECERMQVRLLPPDINVSDSGFTPDGKDIRYGLSAIKGVGEKAFAGILRKRPYGSLADFLGRVPSNALNVGVVGALARSGALDSLCGDRTSLVLGVERLVSLAQEERKHKESGQHLLVRGSYNPSGVFSQSDIAIRKEWELATLGVALSRSQVTIRVGAILTETELEYIHRVIRSHPGVSPVTLDFGLTTLTGCATMSLTEKAREEFEALGKIKVEEN